MVFKSSSGWRLPAGIGLVVVLFAALAFFKHERESREYPVPVDAARIESGRLEVRVTSPTPCDRSRVVARETATRVTVRAFGRNAPDDVSCAAVVDSGWAPIDLKVPLGTRPVIDGHNGQTVVLLDCHVPQPDRRCDQPFSGP